MKNEKKIGEYGTSRSSEWDQIETNLQVENDKIYIAHTVILPDWTLKKGGLSNFSFQSFQGFIGTQNK